MGSLTIWKRTVLLAAAVAMLVIPYTLNFWWKFLPAILGIFLLTRTISSTYLNDLGLIGSKKLLMVSIPVLFTTIAIAFVVHDHLVTLHGINTNNGYGNWHLGWKLMPLSQAFSEELVFRALLLNYLILVIPKRLVVCFVAAGLFMIWHLLFFPYTQGIWLTWSTLLTLFLFGLATNCLFFFTGHIALPFALHGGWNIIKFSTDYFLGDRKLKEAEMFNIVEGSWLVLGLAGILALFAVIKLKSKITKLVR